MSRSLQIVGAGLLGTSVGLALAHAEWSVWIADADESAQRLAGELGAGSAGWSPDDVDLVLLCVPPSSLAQVMAETIRLYPLATISDVLSIKTEPQVQAEKLGCGERFVGGHPMAGRERSGAVAAQADLFDARPWAICASGAAGPERVAVVEQLAIDCGADPMIVEARAHDAAVALVSHLPQVAASAVAGQLIGANPVAMALAGQGLRDTVRIAGSDPALWTEIFIANAGTLAPLVGRLAAELAGLAEALGGGAKADGTGEGRASTDSGRDVDKTIERFLDQGRRGFAQIPGKHGAPATAYTVVPVVIPDEPGALARLFATVAKAGASVEDIDIEHSPGHPVGIVELSVRPDEAAGLVSALDADGWSSH
ncbi:MAG: prephenate dehydrogenase [Actinomycetia bacterium]|nr:prephenate dehydrogenase [Actinomycetes bacterium]